MFGIRIGKPLRAVFSKSLMTPFLLALGGVLTDYATTIIGLSMGFCETHPQYHPLWALLIFWTSIAILHLTMPRRKPWTIGANGLALASYIGTINNILVILELFTGLTI